MVSGSAAPIHIGSRRAAIYFEAGFIKPAS